MADATLPRSDYYVYVLFRHDTGEPFYVGKGCGNRWRRHDNVGGVNPHKDRIVQAAKRSGKEIPKIKLAEFLEEEQAFEAERLFIAAIGRYPAGPLVNLTDGGEGTSGLPLSEAGRLAVSAAHKGKKWTSERRNKLSETNMGRVSPWTSERNKSPAMREALRLRGLREADLFKARIASMSAEAFSARNSKVQQSIPVERRKEIARLRAAAKSPEEHSERIRRANASQTPEQRSARQKKAAETRRRNREALEAALRCVSGSSTPTGMPPLGVV